ncbi:MAG: alpha/beta hydrolase [Firmicutes bacterium]|nr:alpha/beta hydrolase [Bacillota bacterium]
MKKEIFTINSNIDNLPLSVAVIAPEGDVKGVVQLAHGMAEHKARYFPFMEFLAENGYVTILHDHRGHGDSVKSKEDWGHYYTTDISAMVEDTHIMTEYIKGQYPDKPVYLFGHSMGSLVVRAYLRKYDAEIDKLIVCGAPGKNPAVGAANAIIAILKAFKGDRHVSNLMFNLSLGGFNKSVENPRTPCDWLSVNTENVDKYLADPMCGFGFTLNGYKHLMGVMGECFDEKGWGMANKDIPIFFIAGSNDPCIGGKDGWLDSQIFLRKMGYTNVDGKLYEGYRHEILQEEIAEEVYKDVLDFIEK